MVGPLGLALAGHETGDIIDMDTLDLKTQLKTTFIGQQVFIVVEEIAVE